MAAVGFTSGDPNKVDVTGDTMTGDLVLAGPGTDLIVGGSIIDTFGGMTDDVMRLLSTTVSTGITSGGLLSINANPTLLDISPTTGLIYDYNPFGVISATNPQLTQIVFPGQTGVVLTGPPTQTATFWLIDSAGSVIQQATPPTQTQYRTHLVLGVSGQSGGTIFLTQSLAMVQGQAGPQLLDLMRDLGAFVVGPNSSTITPNGANLMINTTGGQIFSPGFGLPNYQDPHTATLAAQTPASFHRATGTAISPLVVNTIDAANYDPGGLGIITPIGGGVNSTTIHRVFVSANPSPNDQIAVQYGQTVYANLSAALAALNAGTFIINPQLIGMPIVAWIAVTRVATDLSDPAQAAFTRAAKFSSP